MVRWPEASSGATRRQRSPLTAAPWANTIGGPLPRSRYSSVPAGTSTVLREPRASLIAMAPGMLPSPWIRSLGERPARHLRGPVRRALGAPGRGGSGRASGGAGAGTACSCGTTSEYRAPVRAVADPWITLAAVAVATERLTIGPLVTPLARRRTHKLARETVTLDRLSGGRLVMGVGLGWHNSGEFDAERFGEEERSPGAGRDARQGRSTSLRATGTASSSRPRAAAAHPGLGRGTLAQAAAARARGALGRVLPDRPARAGGAGRGRCADRGAARAARTGSLDLVVTNPAGTDPQPWIDAGATWCLTGFGMQPTRAEVERAIDAR